MRQHILFLAIATAVIATTLSALGQTCGDDLAWMATSSTPPATGPCDTWVHGATAGADDWAPWQDTNGTWWWFANDPTTTTDKWIYNGPFSVGTGTLLYAQFRCQLDSRYDGVVVELSYDSGTTWTDATTIGGTLSPAYNTTMAGGVLKGRRAYSGTIAATTLAINLTNAAAGSALLRFRVGTDNAIGKWGMAITNFSYWTSPIDPPSDPTGSADNSTTYVSWNQESDPRIVGSQLSDNGGPWIGYQSPYQFTGLVNGVSHTYAIRNIDGNGNASATVTVGPLTPTCTDALPMTLLKIVPWGETDVLGSWSPQTAEIPCGSGTGSVDSYQVYKSTAPNGPWTLISQGSGLTSFSDPWAMVDGNNYFYVVITYKNGVAEQPLPGSQPPPT